MKYYLLTFKEDWADEINVPALACFNETQYNKWLNSKFCSENPDYEEQLKLFEEYQQKYEKFYNDWNNTPDKSTPEAFKWYRENYPHERVEKPIKFESNIHAYLGNSGDGFNESFSDFLYGKDFVENNIVEVTEVTEEFFNLFHKADLSSLSLCNIFEEYDYE